MDPGGIGEGKLVEPSVSIFVPTASLGSSIEGAILGTGQPIGGTDVACMGQCEAGRGAANDRLRGPLAGDRVGPLPVARKQAPTPMPCWRSAPVSRGSP
jgi:hypothetical protein